MTKKEKIAEIVAAYARYCGVGSTEWKEVVGDRAHIISKIDRGWYKEMIDIQYNNFKQPGGDIWYIYHFLCKDVWTINGRVYMAKAK